MTIHYPNDLLRLDFSVEETAALVTILRKRGEWARGAQKDTAVNSRLVGYYKTDETKVERLVAQLEEPGTEVLPADDVRYLRNISLTCPLALKAVNRIWSQPSDR